MGRRILALLFALMCAFAIMPMTALATSGTGLTPSATQSTLKVTYPYADENGDGANDYMLEVGRVDNCFKFTYSTPSSTSEPADGVVTSTFKCALSNYYFYRVTNVANADAVTYGNYEYSSKDREVVVTAADMHVGDADFSKGTVVRDFSRNVYDTGDMYLNVGPTGHVQLDVGETFSLYPLRNWFPIEGTDNVEPMHPDYHVEVVNLETAGAITATERTVSDAGKHKWVISANRAGTALVKVTYDALVHGNGMGSHTDFSAIWPENTGLFVVTAGKSCDVQASFILNAERNAAYAQENEETASSMSIYGTAAKVAGDALDAEFDVLYYAGDAGASYAFMPEAGAQVSVARGAVENGALQVGDFTDAGVSTAADGAVTISGLTTGKHVIRVQKGQNVIYQVVRARAVHYAIYTDADIQDAGKLVVDSSNGVVNAYTDGTTPITREAYEALSEVDRGPYAPLVQPGSEVTVVFDTLYHPANKIQRCYNMTPYISLAGEDGTLYNPENISDYGGIGQYKFASTLSCQRTKITLSDAVKDGVYLLSGTLLSYGYGYDGYGSHRGITYENGRLKSSAIAPLYAAHFGQLPEMALDIVNSAGSGSGGDPGGDDPPDPGPGGDDEEAQQAATAFEALVDAIGTVDSDAADRIAMARAAYDALDAEALALVDANAVTRLQQAEERLAELQRARFTPVDIPESCVRVIAENTTWQTTAGAPWDGMLLDAQVEIDSLQDNMRTLVDKALVQKGFLESSGASNYLRAIEGLGDPESGVDCYGEKAGWMVMLNGWFVNEGMDQFEARTGKIRGGDEIRLVYTCDGGSDVGSLVNHSSKELTNIATDVGDMSPTFSSETTDYMLKLSAGTTQLHVKPTAKNQNWQVRTYLGNADSYERGFRLNDAIPVQDGSVIEVVVGDSTWPSMSASAFPAKTYRIVISIAKDDSVFPDDPDNPPNPNPTTDEKQPVPIITLNVAKVTKSAVSKACKRAGSKPAAIEHVVLGKKVKRIAKSAFSACKKATVLEVRTKKLKKSSVKGCLKGSAVKIVQVKVGSVKANRKYVKKYRKLFKKKACGRKCAIA